MIRCRNYVIEVKNGRRFIKVGRVACPKCNLDLSHRDYCPRKVKSEGCIFRTENPLVTAD